MIETIHQGAGPIRQMVAWGFTLRQNTKIVTVQVPVCSAVGDGCTWDDGTAPRCGGTRPETRAPCPVVPLFPVLLLRHAPRAGHAGAQRHHCHRVRSAGRRRRRHDPETVRVRARLGRHCRLPGHAIPASPARVLRLPRRAHGRQRRDGRAHWRPPHGGRWHETGALRVDLGRVLRRPSGRRNHPGRRLPVAVLRLRHHRPPVLPVLHVVVRHPARGTLRTHAGGRPRRVIYTRGVRPQQQAPRDWQRVAVPGVGLRRGPGSRLVGVFPLGGGCRAPPPARHGAGSPTLNPAMFAWYRPYNCNGAITAAVVAVASSLVAAFPVHNVLLGTGHTAPVVVFGVLLLVASVSLFGTILSDPGIIPRRPPLRPGECKPNRVQDVLVAGQLTRLRWCETCCIFRPPRSAHCWIVDACIENYDHYCPFLGNAIGKGNYRFYLAFIASTSLLTLFSIAVCVVDMALVVQRGRPRSPTDSAPTWTIIFTDAPVTLALTVFLFLAMCFVVGLTVFHTYLIALGMSTNERLRDAFPDGNPYSKGVLRNLTSICCAWPRRGRRRHRRMVPSETAAVASANGSRQSADDNGDSLVLEVRHTIHGQV